MFGIIRSAAGKFVKVQRPKHEKLVVPANGLRITETVSHGGDFLVLVADDRPELPTAQTVPVAKVKDGIQVIVRNDVFFAALAINRKHDKKDFIPEQPVFELAVKRHQRRVIILRFRTTLLEVQRKNGEVLVLVFQLLWPAGKAQ